jgi:hypothetical protein
MNWFPLIPALAGTQSKENGDPGLALVVWQKLRLSSQTIVWPTSARTSGEDRSDTMSIGFALARTRALNMTRARDIAKPTRRVDQI